MLEVTSISASSYDPESLTPLLDEHVRDGWEVISIVSAGTKVIAYLQRESDGESAAGADHENATDSDSGSDDSEDSSAVDEPAGWATSPEDDESPEVAASDATAVIAVTEATAAADEAAAEEVAAAEQVAEVAEPESTVPAGWYADPSGRFELRYWDGSAWTEHVSRAGQQYTDPPVA